MASAVGKHLEAIIAVILMVIGLVFALLATAYGFSIPIPFMQEVAHNLLSAGASHITGTAQLSIACLACLIISVMLLREK